MLGLTSYTTIRRIREIGVRIALGASPRDIIVLLTKKIAMLVSLACIIGLPIGYVVTRNWLNNFAYRVDIGVGVFLSAIVISLVIALLCTSVYAIRASQTNPILTLRNE